MKIFLFTVFIFILLFFFIRHLEKRSLYYPLREIETTPDAIKLDYEDITLTTKDGVQISGWFIPAQNPRATLLFCHGNAGNISHRIEKIQMFNALGLNVLIFDYRGYGTSKGSPSENGLYLDAETMYENLLHKKNAPPGQIIIYGESLGGAVAIDLAGRRESAGVIIEDSFTSAPDMGKKVFPFIPAFIYQSRYDSLQKIKNIKGRKLIFHSIDDEIIPFEHGRKLFEAASQPKEFVRLRGGHNDAFAISRGLFMEKIDSFVNELF
ncbi:MAG: alpha/beta hydrolase [Nitrospirae bacterium]|nr:alpha/beta hydrolase [Nitrospirota bacterium]